MKIQIQVKYETQLYVNPQMQYRETTLLEGQILEVASVEEYKGKYNHCSSGPLYIVTYPSGNFMYLSSLVAKILEE